MMNFTRFVYACCQNGSFPFPKTLLSSDAMPYASAYASRSLWSGLYRHGPSNEISR